MIQMNYLHDLRPVISRLELRNGGLSRVTEYLSSTHLSEWDDNSGGHKPHNRNHSSGKTFSSRKTMHLIILKTVILSVCSICVNICPSVCRLSTLSVTYFLHLLCWNNFLYSCVTGVFCCFVIVVIYGAVDRGGGVDGSAPLILCHTPLMV